MMVERNILDVLLDSERERLADGDNPAKAELRRLEEQIAKLQAEAPAVENTKTDFKFRFVHTEEQLAEMETDLGGHKVLTIDLETTGVNVYQDKIVGVGLCSSGEYGYYIPVGHDGASAQLEISAVMPVLKGLFTGKKIVAHNAKFEYQLFRRYDITLDIGFDPMIAHQLIDEIGQAKLKVIAPIILDVADWSLNLEHRPANKRAIREVGIYCIRDCLYTHQLYEKLEPMMRRDYSFVFYEVELPLIPVVAEMELAGVPIDEGYIDNLKSLIPARLAELTAKIYEDAGKEFNINSSKQLGDVLYQDLGLPVLEVTDKEQPKTDKKTLSKLKGEHEIIERLLGYSSYEKIRSSYLEPDINTETGRIHRSYFQIGAVTGRMTGSGAFHAMTMPKDSSMPLSVRKAVGGLSGFSVVCADYSSQEPRITAAYSNDERLQKAFDDEMKIHGFIAVMMFGLEDHPNEIKAKHPEKYEIGKAIGLGVTYGKTKWGVARDFTEQLGRQVTQDEGQEFIDTYFSTFPKVKVWLENVVKGTRKRGYAEDMVGRRRRFPVLKQKLRKDDKELWKKQAKSEREAKNFMVQGLAVTQTKRAMIRCHTELREHHPQVQIVAARHDEIVFLVPDDELNAVCALIKSAMENDMELSAKGLNVPAEVEITYGPNWGATAQRLWVPHDSEESKRKKK